MVEAVGGEKTIGFVGSLAILLNNVLGPGVASFPGLCQQAGWLPTVAMIGICVVSSFISGELLVMSMRTMPGNGRFQQRVEYSTLCRHYLGRRCASFSILMFLVAMLAANVGTIIQTAQVFDNTIDTLFGDSCAVEFYPSPFRVFCHTSPSDITPFGDGKVLLSLGAIIVAVCSVPLGYWNLDDNVAVQKVAMVLILGSMLAWLSIFQYQGLRVQRVPGIRTDIGLSSIHGLGGTVLFNFMFVSTLPSWVCEKHPSVAATRVLMWTLALSAVAFLAIGICGGMAFREYYATDNTLMSALHHIAHPEALRVFASATVDIYSVAANLTSIPIFAIMLRYNLAEQQLLGPRAAGFASVVAPWLAGVLLYCGKGFADVVQFAGTFASPIVNLFVPCLVFLASQRDARMCPGTGICDTAGSEAIGGREGFRESQAPTDSGAGIEVSMCHEDSSGRLDGPKARRTWLAIARTNAVATVVLTVACVTDQALSGNS